MQFSVFLVNLPSCLTITQFLHSLLHLFFFSFLLLHFAPVNRCSLSPAALMWGNGVTPCPATPSHMLGRFATRYAEPSTWVQSQDLRPGRAAFRVSLGALIYLFVFTFVPTVQAVRPTSSAWSLSPAPLCSPCFLALLCPVRAGGQSGSFALCSYFIRNDRCCSDCSWLTFGILGAQKREWSALQRESLCQRCSLSLGRHAAGQRGGHGALPLAWCGGRVVCHARGLRLDPRASWSC